MGDYASDNTQTRRKGSREYKTVFVDDSKLKIRKKNPPAINQITHVLFTLRGIGNMTRPLHKKEVNIKIKHVTLSRGTKKEQKKTTVCSPTLKSSGTACS